MTWEELQAMKVARDAIKNIAKISTCQVSELNEPYKSAYEKLDEIIKRWECTP